MLYNRKVNRQLSNLLAARPTKIGPKKDEMALINCPIVKVLVNLSLLTVAAANGFKDTCKMVLPMPNKANENSTPK